MAFSFLKHTADVRMNIVGKNLREIFQDAFLGLMSFIYPSFFVQIKDKKSENFSIVRMVKIKSLDKVSLLVDFLNDLVWKSQVYKEIYVRLEILKLTSDKIEAKILGKKAGGFEREVKAITYHQAQIKKNSNGNLTVDLVFDI